MANILVTGIGGLLGQAVVKALRLSPGPFALHGCDSESGHAGEAFVRHHHVVPLAKERARYIETLDAICRERHIEAVVPTSIPEIDLLSTLGEPPALPCGARIICQPASWIERYDDKLTCMRALQGHVPLVPFADGRDLGAVDRLVSQAGFPLVVKARRCGGSRSVTLIEDGEALQRALAVIDDPVVQGYLDGEDQEYSVGLFGMDGHYEALALRRHLGLGGCSWYAEVVEAPDVTAYAVEIARATDLVGSANVQVRRTSEGVRLLEINARFSSLVAARAAAGFRDAEWSVRQALGMDLGPIGGPYKPLRFARFFHEMIDEGQGFAALAPWTPRARY